MSITNLPPDFKSIPLGKASPYINHYSPSLLFPVPRKLKRDEIGVQEAAGVALPFSGIDIWNGFELSWLNLKGKPVVAIADIRVACESPCIIESKSLKLYLNSLNNSAFESLQQVREILVRDLSKCAGMPVSVKLMTLNETPLQFGKLEGTCLDDLDIECTDYLPNLDLLTTSDQVCEEALHTHLLKSNCLITGQPDWASLFIRYKGKKIDRAGLLKYVVSFRDHNEFHEQCVERIFMDIVSRCQPEKLTVYGRYTRRGGLDINPFRTNEALDFDKVDHSRLVRQ